ncbi:amino acid permease [Bacillus clarus]|uniref:Amino acid permease n=1 Tax=Bacillus clarus TaxID=2338372 RepID=A0A090YUD8_9BACI|nr:amino acid permease [Bacillus clarus]KFM95685.1 amino acid permease family protein [Bacillus clarus]RFT62878.1 amino acid permease [Bacillus clarus]
MNSKTNAVVSSREVTVGDISKVNKPTAKLQKSLKTKHLTMISIGGSIGTGLFISSGTSIYIAGPGGALVAYVLIGIMVYLLMMSLGEMATYMPDSGSFSTYASRYIDPALGFALGWNYWYTWAITIAVELSASAIIMKFWFPNIPGIIWSALFLAIILMLNYFSVRSFGEAEYWFSLIKVITIIIFLIVGVLTIIGIMGGEHIGFKNLAFSENTFHGGFLSILSVFMIAGFSFQGTELIGIAAGESQNPEKDVPKSIKQVFWRILLFYILAIFVIGLIIPYNHPNLMNEDVQNISMSPFTIVFEKSGIAFAASVMNAVILTAILSAANSGMYASTRMLWVLAKEGKAPKFLTKVSKSGIPVNALIATALVGMFAFLSSFLGEGRVFMWLLNSSGLSGFIAWTGIAISHYRFRKAYIAQGGDVNKLPYKAKWYPFSPIVSTALCIIVIIGQKYEIFMGKEVAWESLLMTYSGLPIFFALWFFYKWKNKTKIIPLQECNLQRKS